MHDWPVPRDGGVPTPTLVAAWLKLNVLPTERIPLWAAHWLTAGHDGDVLAELAGLHGDDPYDVRDLLRPSLAECGVVVPATYATAAMTAFTAMARLQAAGHVDERWVADKVNEVVRGSGYCGNVMELPLSQLYSLEDQWGGWRHAADELAAVTRRACLDQLQAASQLG